jgi:beta-glucuronidase
MSARGRRCGYDVHPWAPGDGYLYDLEVRLVDAAGALIDSYHQSVGVRTVEVRGTQFLINGEPFHFTGFGMHEDHPTLGKGHNDAFLVQDFGLLEWIGANSFRTSHYPYSEDVLDHTDGTASW